MTRVIVSIEIPIIIKNVNPICYKILVHLLPQKLLGPKLSTPLQVHTDHIHNVTNVFIEIMIKMLSAPF